MADYKPYSVSWTRKRALREILYEYLEDPNTNTSQVCEDIKDVLDEWIGSYSSRVEKGKELRDFFK